MTLLDRAVEAVFKLPAIDQAISQRVSRAYEAGLSDGNDDPVTGTTKSQGYRRVTASGLRDFTRMSYDKILSTVWTLFQSNPIAKRVLKLKVDHYLGTGIEYQVEDETVQEVLDTNWQANKLDDKIRKFAFELRLWGEQLYPVFVRQADGRTELGYFDPFDIEKIITHPDNAMERWMIVIKQNVSEANRRVYRVVREDEDFVRDEEVIPARNPGLLTTYEQVNLQPWEERLLRSEYGLTEYTGSVLLRQINNVSNQPRGFSDLLQSADWIDILDDTLFAIGEREQFASFFSWDVELEGADKTEVATRRAEIQKNVPKRGSARVHNDKETWTLNWPDLKQMGSIETVKTLLGFILGGMGIPIHWYGYGGDTNRATALAQGDPTWKMLEEEQDEIRDMIILILTFFRDQAIIAGTLERSTTDIPITVTMPQMTKKDLNAIAQTMNNLATALMVAEQQGWSSPEQAITAWQKIVQELGVETEDVQELIKIKQELDFEKERRRQDMLKQFSQNGSAENADA